ncbi:MAG: diacylglycerol kinase family lipid kinase [Bacteroidales bacterium]|nr:diacylglycerol kinase family lipid kinase [Bacteroidales bacterium]
MKLLLVYNPFAGFKKSGKYFSEVKQLIRSKGMDFDLRFTRAAGEAETMVEQADLTLYDGIISSGGDGTFHEVLNGYYKNKSETKPPIGIIPNGTGNSFAIELGLKSFEFEKAIDIISKNKIKKVDIGFCQMKDKDFYFHNILGFGMVADINDAANKYKKLGNLSYTIASLEKIMALRTFPLEIILDGKSIKQENLFVEISNTRYTGSSFLMAPKAKVDDGLLDITISRKTSRWKVLKIFLSIFEGKHIEHNDIEYIQAKKIIVKTKDNKTLTPDGEQYGSTPITVECKKDFLDFFWS